MKPSTMAMISNAVQREPPWRRQRAPAHSPGPNSRAPYEPPIVLSAVPITDLLAIEAATPTGGGRSSPLQIGSRAPARKRGPRKNRTPRDNEADLNQWE